MDINAQSTDGIDPVSAERVLNRAERRAAESNKSTRRAITVSRFVETYDLSRATTFRLIASGKLKSVKVMGRRLILVDSAESLLEEAA